MLTKQLTPEQWASGKYDSFLWGQRMSLNCPVGCTHEYCDDYGIYYAEDGTRTAWMREGSRLHTPDWEPWHKCYL
jgi:hypothetical protein